MQKLQLYISGERIDLFKDEQVSFNQSIQNIKDPAKIFTEFTQTFTVPASKTNNQIFQHYYNFNIVNPNDLTQSGFDARNKVDALIELNNITFKQGYVKLEGVDLKLNKAYAYRITFFGETVNLKDRMRDETLGILDDLAQYGTNLTYDAASIKAKLQNGSNNILCPLITSGASGTNSRLYYNSGSHADDDGNLFYQSAGHNHGVLWSDLKYAISVWKIIEAIEEQYDFVFTDDFFNSTNLEFYTLCMWLHRKKGSVAPDSQITQYPTLVTGFGLPQTYTGMISGNGLQIFGTALPDIQQDLELTVSSGTSSYDVLITRNGQAWASLPNNTGTTTFTQSDYPAPMDAATYTITILVTAQVNFSSAIWNLSGYIQGGVGGWTETYNSGSFNATTSFEFIIQQQVPDIKCIDFLTGIFRMFNLTAYYVSNRQDADYGKIKVQKLDDFYLEGTSYDISEYIDASTTKVNVALPYKEIEFGYEGNGTLLALQYEQLNGKRWGAEQFTGNATIGNNFDAPNPIYKVTLPFEHMQMERLVDADPTGIGQTSIQYGYFVDDNLEAYYGKPLFFYPILIVGGTQISFKTDTDPASHPELITQYYIPSNSVSLSSVTGTGKLNCNFYNERNEWDNTTNFTKTLFNENYLTYIQDIFNSKRRLIKTKAYLPLKIIYNLNMNDTVVINNQNYIINTINTNLNTGESNMELLNKL
jgi:hypothetical protein